MAAVDKEDMMQALYTLMQSIADGRSLAVIDANFALKTPDGPTAERFVVAMAKGEENCRKLLNAIQPIRPIGKLEWSCDGEIVVRGEEL